MAEYIEREKLLSEVKAEKPLNWTDSEAEIQADGDYDYFIAMIESQPKADVAEVKHGEWMRSTYANDFYRCSECDAVWNRKFIFCPSCGAKMDKE